MHNIIMIPVSSSNVDSVGYDEATETLKVRFLNGSEYIYMNVPIMEYEGLLKAPSVGSYLNRNIKGTYNYQKV